MTGGVVWHQMLALRHLAEAFIKATDAMMVAMEEEAQKKAQGDTAPSPPPPPPSPPEDGPCMHPVEYRIPLPVMGKKKFKCMVCNTDVLAEETAQ